MKCPNWGKNFGMRRRCVLQLCACSKPQDVLPDHTATPETSATVAPTAAVVQATATHAPTDTTVPTILPQTADAGRSYVDDTLFIGDSNTVRYTMYADDTGTAFSTLKNNIGVVSMGGRFHHHPEMRKVQGRQHPVHHSGCRCQVAAQTHYHWFRLQQPWWQLHGCHQVHLAVPGGAGRHHQSMALCGYYRQRHSPAGPAAGQHQPDHDPGRCLQRRSCDNVRGGRLQIFEHRRSTAG